MSQTETKTETDNLIVERPVDIESKKKKKKRE